ncbi:MAG: hypothetical protein ACJ79A_06600 [Gemmatimonadaceae bacterium]
MRSTADTHRDGDAETDARLTGLIPRLTSPSRNNAQLVDIWFSIDRPHRSDEWDDVFTRVAEGWRPDPGHQSHFALFSHPCSSALIVARQVSPDPSAWRDIEVEAQALVSRVNREVAGELSTPVPTGTAQRNWLSDAAQTIRGLVPKPSIPVSHSSSTSAR